MVLNLHKVNNLIESFSCQPQFNFLKSGKVSGIFHFKGKLKIPETMITDFMGKMDHLFIPEFTTN
jgi:hypothetical protein